MKIEIDIDERSYDLLNQYAIHNGYSFEGVVGGAINYFAGLMTESDIANTEIKQENKGKAR